MAKPKNIKNIIIKSFLSGKTYNTIAKELKCSKGTISYHCADIRNENDKFKNPNWVKCSKEQYINSWKKWKESVDKTTINKILLEPFDKLSLNRLRKRIIYEQNGKCFQCGISNWCNSPIILELEHKDGNRDNNKRENLEALCPNCHSQTKTWRGRNSWKLKRIDKRYKVPDDKMIKILIKNNFNINRTLIDAGLAPKGGNYKRCYKLKREIENGLNLIQKT